jgi:hypothetical protein
MNNNRIPLKDQLEGETTDAQVEGGRIGFSLSWEQAWEPKPKQVRQINTGVYSMSQTSCNLLLNFMTYKLIM